jgi:hypothetical protein
MKQLLTILLLSVGLFGFGQNLQLTSGSPATGIPTWFLSPNTINTNIHGNSISKGDTVALYFNLKDNSAHVRGFYFDIQYQYKQITYISAGLDTAVGGSAHGTTPVANYLYMYNYPGYIWAGPNGTDASWNYNRMSYNYNNGNNAILRLYGNYSSSADFADGRFLKVLFQYNSNIPAGFKYDSIYFNWAYTYNSTGGMINSYMPNPQSVWTTLDPAANSLVDGSVRINFAGGADIKASAAPKFVLKDSATKTYITSLSLDATNVYHLSTEVSPNTAYTVTGVIDSMAYYLDKAVTVSDYTKAAYEFAQQNLDGTFKWSTNISTGAGAWAADVNNNGKFDGGDPIVLLNHVMGLDNIANYKSHMLLVPATLLDTLTPAHAFDTGLDSVIAFKTGATAIQKDIAFVVPGDINHSHSSAPIITNSQGSSIATNSISGITYSTGYKTNAINTVQNVPTIDVSLNNVVVTGDTLSIPFDVDTKGNKMDALEFEIIYDQSKLQFTNLSVNMGDWLDFATVKDGAVRFGGIDKTLKYPITGKVTPFRLNFKTLQPGVDINTVIRVSPVMDASDNTGNQLGINLNTNILKIMGSSNF